MPPASANVKLFFIERIYSKTTSSNLFCAAEAISFFEYFLKVF